MILRKLFAYVCFSLLLSSCASWNQPSAAERRELRTRIEQWNREQIVREIYAAREFRPIWTARGRKLPHIQQFFQLVDDRSHGLHPEDFNIDPLRQEKHADLVQFDIDMTSALAKYASAVARKDADVKQALQEATDSGSVAQLADRLAPVHVEYARLRGVLQNVSPADRRKIEINMKRWRQLPDNLGERHISVNIPAFKLEVHEGTDIPLEMKVVVGTTEDKTPVFSSEMKYVAFSPYWNIPESILAKETLPKIMQDPEYVTRQNLEVVRISGKDVAVVDPKGIDWERVGASNIQIRQRPGNTNSLGLVKFMFPNRYGVYLHDTPAGNLFDRLTRTFSHGCVRVEKPEELAEYVLRDQPEWTPDRIREAMHAGEEKHVGLKKPLPVHIVYFTASVDDGGKLHVETDVYGYDTL